MSIAIVSFLKALRLIKATCTVISRKTHNPDMVEFINDIDRILNNPAAIKLRIQDLNAHYQKLLSGVTPEKRQEIQNNINESLKENGITPIFNNDGQLIVSMDDFVNNASDFCTPDVGDMMPESVDIAELSTDVTEPISAAVQSASDIVLEDATDTIADACVDNADSLWDFLSSLFS